MVKSKQLYPYFYDVCFKFVQAKLGDWQIPSKQFINELESIERLSKSQLYIDSYFANRTKELTNK